MKVARSLLVALAAFGAVTATVAQPPGPVTPPACQMACHKGEYAKIQACGSDADCIAQVKASIASCMAACPPSSSTPNGAMVGDFTCSAKCVVKYGSCAVTCTAGDMTCYATCGATYAACSDACGPAAIEAEPITVEAPKQPTQVGFYSCQACTGDYSQCFNECPAGDAHCLNSCVNMFMGCMGQCEIDSVKASVASTVGATPVGDAKKQTLCRMACIGVDAAAKSACQHWMPGSTLCLENVADARQMCDIGCGLLEAPAMPPKLKGTACEASCNADYKGCMKLLGSSYSKCTRDQTACFKLCHQSVASPLRRVAAAAQSRVGDAECAKCAASLKDCFMGCNFDAQCSGRCFSNDWQCQLSC